MPLVQAKCTNCGASLLVDNAKEAAICQYCGAAYVVEQAINNFVTMKDPAALHALGDEAVAECDYETAEKYYTELYTQNSRDLSANAKRLLVHSVNVLHNASPNGLYQDGVKWYSNSMQALLKYFQSNDNVPDRDIILLLRLLYMVNFVTRSGFRVFNIHHVDDLRGRFLQVLLFAETAKAHVEILNCCIEQKRDIDCSEKAQLVEKSYAMIHRTIDGKQDEILACASVVDWNRICELEAFFAGSLPSEYLKSASKPTIPTDSSVQAMADASGKKTVDIKKWKKLILTLIITVAIFAFISDSYVIFFLMLAGFLSVCFSN